MRIPKEKVAIIGLGNVGTTMAVALQNAGYEIAAVSAASAASLERNVRFLKTYSNIPCYTQTAAAARLADVILITTQDDKIGGVCEQIARAGAICNGDKVIHMSGAGGLDLLQPAAECGAHIASIHPIQSFTNLETSLAALPGTVFGVTSSEDFQWWCFSFVENLQGIPIMVSADDKPLYHAASCITSSYISTLLYIVEEIYKTVGMTSTAARQAFLPLAKGTLRNIEERGQVAALSGPIARGDVHTIVRHIRSLNSKLPHFLPVYLNIGLQAVQIAAQKETLTKEKLEQLREIFLGGNIGGGNNEHTQKDHEDYCQ